MKTLKIIIILPLIILTISGILTAQSTGSAGNLSAQDEVNSKTEENVIYGMHGGLALLMDIFHPENSNGYGIIMIPGSGWHQPLSFDAKPLSKRNGYQTNVIGKLQLLKGGYTLFIINHRSAPVFRYPAAVEDARRAVQFIRYHARKYEIDSTKIGAIGHSSGGHLVNMLGTMDDIKDSGSEGTIDQKSAKVQAVVSLSAPTDLVKASSEKKSDIGAISSFLGTHIFDFFNSANSELSLFSEASPTTHVTSDDAPFLIVHGRLDEVVPFDQAEVFKEKLHKKNVPVKLIIRDKGNHILRNSDTNEIDNTLYYEEVVRFFDRYLQNKNP